MQRIDASTVAPLSTSSPLCRRLDHDTPVYEYTQWTTIADLEARKYYFRTYDDTVMRVIDLATSTVSTVASPTHIELTIV
ncbi:penicillin amidase [Burkholderia lata]|uniref:Penicillin amidase n=1 Tax=Burkholderia lata (strain ATCC 17760 / DSM 23089 / LMG 22485 / NCIMB 9086 / R18194 / 383) TaxID=482957 RepID=A0A6P2U354_BURL3|nr:linear amide C-N hydrolase [Burkholderia lata]VWC63904.1 penicillin amidase [Burkholderia lata]